MKWFEKKEAAVTAAEAQLRTAGGCRFGILQGCSPISPGESRLYRAVRQAVPLIDAAIYKLIRLTGGLSVHCGDRTAENGMREFLKTVDVGRGQRGINAFLEGYLDSLLTCGQAVGEILPAYGGRDITALLCGRTEDIRIREGDSPLHFTICGFDKNGAEIALPHQELLLFTPLNPEADSPYGVSLLRSLPFFAELLLKIYDAVGQNWERCGNVRYAVVCKPQGDEMSRSMAQERCGEIAREWASAMESTKGGSVRDFVAVGDVDIRVIGADNRILDSEVPVRQLLEQIVAKTGLPPFMLGMNWSSTERMSSQQADMLTTEITAIRRTLTPMVERICSLWLRAHGYGCGFEVVWDDINLQDQVEEAKAELYRQQARRLQIENEKEAGA